MRRDQGEVDAAFFRHGGAERMQGREGRARQRLVAHRHRLAGLDREVGANVFERLMAIRLELKKGSTGALTGLMRELETLLGVTLVERTRRMVRFTALGEKIADNAVRVLREDDAATNHRAAKQMFGYSIFYLFAIFGLLIVDHTAVHF